MRYSLAIPLLGYIPLVTGCYLPIPYLHKRCDAIEGSVADGSTGLPVKAATVSVLNQTYGVAYRTQTDSDGPYRLDAQYRLVPITPFLIDDQDTPPVADIWIDAQGYQATTYKSIFLAGNEARSRPTRDSSSAESLVGKFSEGTWHFTAVRLVPQEPPAPQERASPP